MPCARLSPDAVTRARQGKALEAADFNDLVTSDGPGAWLSPDGELVAVGTMVAPLKVLRGFNTEVG